MLGYILGNSDNYLGGVTMKSTFYVEFYGKQIDQADLIKEAKSIWTKSGKKAADLTSVELYVKPEDNKAYYVFNEDETGSFDL